MIHFPCPAELYEQMPACRSLSAGRTEAEELDLSACGHAQADAAIRRNLEVLGYGE